MGAGTRKEMVSGFESMSSSSPVFLHGASGDTEHEVNVGMATAPFAYTSTSTSDVAAPLSSVGQSQTGLTGAATPPSEPAIPAAQVNSHSGQGLVCDGGLDMRKRDAEAAAAAANAARLAQNRCYSYVVAAATTNAAAVPSTERSV